MKPCYKTFLHSCIIRNSIYYLRQWLEITQMTYLTVVFVYKEKQSLVGIFRCCSLHLCVIGQSVFQYQALLTSNIHYNGQRPSNRCILHNVPEGFLNVKTDMSFKTFFHNKNIQVISKCIFTIKLLLSSLIFTTCATKWRS